MKKFNIKNIGFAMLLGLIFFSACKDPLKTEYTEYSPTPVTKSNVNLTYLPATGYPSLIVHKSDTPTFIIDGVYKFNLDTVISSTSNGFVKSNFVVDPDYGVIEYNNKGATLLPGNIQVSVSVTNISGLVIFDDAFEFEVLDVPITLSVDNEVVDTGVLYQGLLATVSYTDSSPDQSITSVSYTLAPEILGFSIDASSGEISKTSEAESGVHMLSVFVNTNLGSKSFESLVSVTIGPPPTINYKQLDGINDLTMVTLSPWTAYTSQVPTLQDMVAVQWELIVPAGLDPSAVSVASDGEISVLGGKNILDGDYSIGVKAINSSGTSFDFVDLFVLHVEKRWEASPVFYEDFNSTTITPELVNNFNSALNSYSVSGGIQVFNAVTSENLAKDRLFQSAKMRDGKNDIQMQAVLILALTMDPSWYNMRVSFNELFGYGDNRLEWWERTLGFSYDDSGVAGGTYNPANWNMLMEASDPDWSSSKGTNDGARDTDMNQIPAKDFGGIDNTQSTMFINWFIGETSLANGTIQQGAEFHIDNIKVEVSKAFPAEEN